MNKITESDTLTRQMIRSGEFTGNTAGLCKGFLQTNIVILPYQYSKEFTEFCQSNPKPCPLLAIGEPGSTELPSLGADLNICTDMPGYALYQNGQYERTVSDISSIWREDYVTFALGCSFTFEDALQKVDVPMRHIDLGRTVPMYKTNVDVAPTANFGSKLVVSMRPIPRQSVSTVELVCSKFPHAHGGPVHWGNAEDIGIHNLTDPDWGESVPIDSDEVAAFWACGVTSQVALQSSMVPHAITHKPGSMLITNIPSDTPMEVFGKS